MKKIPAYLENAILYQINPRSFTNEGTINAMTKMLPYIKKAGFDIVYICPVVCSDKDPENWSGRQIRSKIGNPQNPYRLSDYFNVDEEYGTNDDLKEFVKVAHENGLKILFDLVYYHCGPNANVLKEHPEFIAHNEDGSMVMGAWGFPMFDYSNNNLREYLIGNMEHFIKEYNVDGFRCDVGDMVPLHFWKQARERMDEIGDDIVLLNEGKKPDYLDAFDLNYSWNLFWAFSQNIEKGDAKAAVDKVIETFTNDLSIDNHQISCFIQNHDVVNDELYNRIDVRFTVKGANACYIANFLLPNVPFIYAGIEVGDTNRHSLYGNRFYAGNMTIDWNNILTKEGKDRFDFISKLCDLHHNIPAFGLNGKLDFIGNDNKNVLVFTREKEGAKYVVVVNYSKEAQTVKTKLALDSFNVLMQDSAKASVKRRRLNVELEGFGYFVARVN